MKTSKTVNTEVYNFNTLPWKTLTGDKRYGLNTATYLYKLEDADKYDSGYEELIHAKIKKVL